MSIYMVSCVYGEDYSVVGFTENEDEAKKFVAAYKSEEESGMYVDYEEIHTNSLPRCDKIEYYVTFDKNGDLEFAEEGIRKELPYLDMESYVYITDYSDMLGGEEAEYWEETHKTQTGRCSISFEASPYETQENLIKMALEFRQKALKHWHQTGETEYNIQE